MGYAIRKITTAAYPEPKIFADQMNLEDDMKGNVLPTNENEVPQIPDLREPEAPDIEVHEPPKIVQTKANDSANMSSISKKTTRKDRLGPGNLLPPIEHSVIVFNRSKMGLAPVKSHVEKGNASKISFLPFSGAQESQFAKKDVNFKSGEVINPEPIRKELDQKANQPLCIGDVIFLETRKCYETNDKISNEAEYVGVLSGDKITSNSLYTVGKTIGTQWVAENYVKESLFRIECKQNYVKIEGFEKMKNILLLTPDKYNKDKWNQGMKEAQTECQTNDAELVQKKESPIQYGQTIQLRHLFTNSYVSVATNQISREGGSQQVELTKGSEKVWLKFIPGTKTAKMGDIVKYGESLLIMSKADQDNNYLHASDCLPLASTDEPEPNDEEGNEHKVFIAEVNASVTPSSWRPRLCVNYKDLETKSNTLKVGDMFKIFHVNSEYYLTISKRDTNVKLMQNMREEGRNITLEVILTNIQDNEAALCWQLERAEEFVGGPADWDGYYKLRHVLTGMYLTYYMQRGEFKLASAASGGGTLVQLHPLNIVQSSNNDKQILNQMYIAITIRGGVVVPPQVSPDDLIKNVIGQSVDPPEQKLFYKERSGLLSSNCIYQVQKLSKVYDTRVNQGIIYYENFFYYNRELTYETEQLNRKPDNILEPDMETKRGDMQPAGRNNNSESVILEEIGSKLELFANTLIQCEEKTVRLMTEAQNSFSDTFNIDCLVSLLEVLETKFASQDFIRTRERTYGGNLCKFDHKIKQIIAQTTDNNALAPKYIEVSRLIYKSLHKLCIGNKKASTIVLNYSKFFSGQVYQFNKEIRKVLGESIVCAMPFVNNDVDYVYDWFNLLAPIIKTSTYNNILDQLVSLKVLRGLCGGQQGKGNVANQRSCFKLIQETSSVVVGFGTEENRPYVSFNQNDKSEQDFLTSNPYLTNYSRTLETTKEKVLCVYLDDLSRNQKITIDYISYLAHILKLFAAMCTGRFNAGIVELTKRGLNGFHLVTCLKMGTKKLHPKLIKAYLELAKVMCIDIEPFTSLITSPNRCYFWDDFNKEDNYTILSEEDCRLEEPNEKEIVYRISDIRLTFEAFLTAGLRVTTLGMAFLPFLDSWKTVRQYLKIVINWLIIGKSLLEFRQVTPEFMEKTLQFVVCTLCARDDSPYSSVAVITYSNSGAYGWIRGMMELGKISNKDQLQLLKEIALDVHILIHKIKGNIQLISFLKCFKKEYSAGYTPHESEITIQDLKEKIASVFKDTKVKLPKAAIGSDDPQLASIFYQSLTQFPPSKMFGNVAAIVPLDLYLLSLIFEENRGFTSINNKAMEALILSFNQRPRLIEELAKVDIVVSQDDYKLYLFLLREKKLAKLLIDNILNQNTIFVKTEKTAQKKKTVTEMQELLQRIIELITSEDVANKKKVQNFLKHLRFYSDLMGLFQIAAIDIGLISGLLKGVVKFLFLFCSNNSVNQGLLVSHATTLLEMSKYNIKISKLIHQVFLCARSQKEEKWLIDYLLQQLKKNETPNPDIMRLLAALADSAAEKHSKYILKSLLSMKMQSHIMMNVESAKQKEQLFWKWKREPKSAVANTVKCHFYIITAISNCAEHCEYGRVQGRKLATEEDIMINLTASTSNFMLKTIYLRLYYSLYLYQQKTEERSRTPPNRFTDVLKVIQDNLSKFKQYEGALEGRIKKTRIFKLRSGSGDKADSDEDDQVKSKSNNPISKEESKHYSNDDSNHSGGEEIIRNQKRVDVLEYTHNPNEYWTFLSPRKKIEAEKNGLLNFLIETFNSNSWDISEEVFSLIVDIRSLLMEIYDSLYKFQEEKNGTLDIDDIAFMVCKAIESLPSTVKQTDKLHIISENIVKADTAKEKKKRRHKKKNKDAIEENKQENDEDKIVIENNEEEKVKVSISEDHENKDSSPKHESIPEQDKDPARDLNPEEVKDSEQDDQASDSQNESADPSSENLAAFQHDFFKTKVEPKDQSVNEQQVVNNRKRDNFEYVIDTIKKYIMAEKLTIREAFKLFDANADQKVDRLELKKSIKDICKSQVSYQQIEDTIEHIELTMGNGSSSGALAFAEFSAALKKSLKKAQYKNYKDKPEEVSDVQLEETDTGNTIKINISLKHFIIDYKRCMDYIPDEIEIKELAYKLSSIIHFLMKKNKVGDISILISHLSRAFVSEEYKKYLLDIFLTLLELHKETVEKEPTGFNKKMLSDLLKIYVREGVLSKAIDVLSENTKISLHQKACILLTSTLEWYQNKRDCSHALEAQRVILNYLTQTKKFEGMFRNIRKVLENCSRQIRKRKEGEVVSVYDASLFLVNMNLANTIDRINQVNGFIFTNQLLYLIYLLSSNAFTSFQEFLRSQVISNPHADIASVNILGTSGLLLIAMTELDDELYLRPSYYRIIPNVFDALTQMCIGSCVSNQTYLGTWIKFVKALNYFISRKIPWCTESEDELAKQKGFTCVVTLLNALLSEESALRVAPTLLNELDIWSLRWKLSEIYENKMMYQQRYYIDDIVCTHVASESRTCTEYYCVYGYLTANDKAIIKTAYDAFIFLSKLKELYPEHASIEDFAQEVSPVKLSTRNVKATNAAQIVPMRKMRTDTMPYYNAEYSILNDSDDASTARMSTIESKPKEGCLMRILKAVWNKLCCKSAPVESVAKTEDGLSKNDIRQVLAVNILESAIAKQRKLNYKIKSAAGTMLFAKLKRQEQIDRELKRVEISAAELYYLNNVRSVEIYYNKKLEKVYFPVPTYCRYMTREMQRQAILETTRESQQTKLQDLSMYASLYQRDLKHQQKISRISPTLRNVTSSIGMLKNISLSIVFLVNILLLTLYTYSNGQSMIYNNSANQAILFFGSIQAILSVCILSAYSINNFPVLFNFDSRLLTDKTDRTFMKKVQKKKRLYKATAIFSLLFWIVYVVISFVGLIYYLALPFLLLYIIPEWPGLWSIVKALYKNSSRILQTIVLILVVIYIYAIWGFQYLNGEFNTSDDTNNCSNLIDCFTLSFSLGLRSFGGIGDALSQNSYSHDSGNYWGRYWYDVTAFIIINGLLLCLLWGIILDILSEMQRQYSGLLQEVDNNCFICGINKFEIETKGRGWKRHLQQEHKVTDYMAYLIYIDEKDKSEQSALEMYVKQKINDNSVEFFPIGKSLSVRYSQEIEKHESIPTNNSGLGNQSK